jgi:hypothetical protein
MMGKGRFYFTYTVPAQVLLNNADFILLDQQNLSCNETINRMICNQFGTLALTISDVWN